MGIKYTFQYQGNKKRRKSFFALDFPSGYSISKEDEYSFLESEISIEEVSKESLYLRVNEIAMQDHQRYTVYFMQRHFDNNKIYLST